MFLNSFVEAKRRPFSDGEEVKPVTLIDVCSGSSEHINLKHVVSEVWKLKIIVQFCYNFVCLYLSLESFGV